MDARGHDFSPSGTFFHQRSTDRDQIQNPPETAPEIFDHTVWFVQNLKS